MGDEEKIKHGLGTPGKYSAKYRRDHQSMRFRKPNTLQSVIQRKKR